VAESTKRISGYYEALDEHWRQTGYTRLMKITRKLLNILLATALVASLAACGNKGPLVHPDKVKPAEEPAASSH